MLAAPPLDVAFGGELVRLGLEPDLQRRDLQLQLLVRFQQPDPVLGRLADFLPTKTINLVSK